jgi:hypothetical protein
MFSLHVRLPDNALSFAAVNSVLVTSISGTKVHVCVCVSVCERERERVCVCV